MKPIKLYQQAMKYDVEPVDCNYMIEWLLIN